MTQNITFTFNCNIFLPRCSVNHGLSRAHEKEQPFGREVFCASSLSTYLFSITTCTSYLFHTSTSFLFPISTSFIYRSFSREITLSQKKETKCRDIGCCPQQQNTNNKWIYGYGIKKRRIGRKR